jgi:hypothetical protein
MTEAAAIEETVNANMISHLLIIYRVAHRVLSAEERVGTADTAQRSRRDRGAVSPDGGD